MLRLTLFRTPILIHPSFWITVALFGGIVSVDCVWTFCSVLFFMAVAFVSLLAHELGHALVGRWLGGGEPRILISGLGGECCNQQVRLSRGQGILMTIAGPLSNLLLLLGAIGVFYLSNGYDIKAVLSLCSDYLGGTEVTKDVGLLPMGIASIVRAFVVVNFWWFFINLLPIYPLDGGQVLCGLLKPTEMRLAHGISIYAAILLAMVFFLLQLWLPAIFMLILLYVNWKWWRAFGAMHKE